MAAGRMKHAYFGPKDPVTGERPEEAPPYYHQSVPTILYHPEWTGWPREGKTFNTQEEVDAAVAKGWLRSPAQAGVITEPSAEQREAVRVAEFEKKIAKK